MCYIMWEQKKAQNGSHSLKSIPETKFKVTEQESPERQPIEKKNDVSIVKTANM